MTTMVHTKLRASSSQNQPTHRSSNGRQAWWRQHRYRAVPISLTKARYNLQVGLWSHLSPDLPEKPPVSVLHVTGPLDSKVQGFPFLKLPAELRNKIYDYCFDGKYIVEIMPRRAKHIRRMSSGGHSGRDLTPIRSGRNPRLLGSNFDEKSDQKTVVTKWGSSLPALHLVNKQIAHEIKLFLYSTPTFYFQSPRAINKFCSRSFAPGLDLITRLDVAMDGYGQPFSAVHVKWVHKFYESWTKAFASMVTHMPNVQDLRLLANVQQEPVVFTFRQNWVQPIMELRNFKNLKSIKVNLTSYLLYPNLTGGSGRATNTKETELQWHFLMHRMFADALEKRIMGMCESCSVEGMLSAALDEESELRKWIDSRPSLRTPVFRRFLDWSWLES